MPSYTLGEIMSHATFAVGRRSDLEASRVSFWANEAYMEVADIAPLSLSETTTFLSFVSGSASTALPADLHEPILFSWMSGGSGTTLTWVSPGAIDSYGTGTGVPEYFTLYGGNIEVRPVPESDLTVHLRYRTQITDLISTSSVPSINTAWRPAIVRKLEEKLHYALGNAEGAALAQQRYMSLVATLKSDEARRQLSNHEVGISMPGYE